MSNALPELTVVGSVNKGKSSLVTALCEIDSGLVDPRPRSTRKANEYTFNDTDGTSLFRIIDTPGFQRAREALQWVREKVDGGLSEPDAIRAFIDRWRDDTAFEDEWRLLEPILAGSGILYVVDGSAPFNPAAMAEMDLLRMTGRPRMAVINQTRADRNFSEELRSQLTPYFKVVSFDTHAAGWEDRLALWTSFRGIDDEWAPAIDHVIAALRRELEDRREAAATAIAEMLGEVAAFEWRRTATRSDAVDRLREKASEAFLAFLRDREQHLRSSLRRIHRHRRNLSAQATPLPPHLELDIEDRHSWRIFGLPRKSLIKLGVAGGAAAGLAVDASTGALALGIPTAIGAVSGGILALTGTHKLMRTRVRRIGRLGREVHEVELQGGKHVPLMFMMLDRALQTHRYLENLSHANRGVPDSPEPGAASITAGWDEVNTRDIHQTLKTLSDHDSDKRSAACRSLGDQLQLLIEESDAP